MDALLVAMMPRLLRDEKNAGDQVVLECMRYVSGGRGQVFSTERCLQCFEVQAMGSVGMATNGLGLAIRCTTHVMFQSVDLDLIVDLPAVTGTRATLEILRWHCRILLCWSYAVLISQCATKVDVPAIFR